MEHVLALDPGRDAVRTRLELVRFRRTQALIEAGRRAREAGRLDDAGRQLQEALALSPESTMILHELTLVETAAHEYDEAEAHAREAIRLEPRNAEWQAALGTVLEARGKLSEAAAAYARAVAIDPQPEWSVRSADLRERAERAALPPEFGRLRTATTVTRAQVAALIGIRLSDLIRRAPRRVAEVATDVRTHWAAPWILPVTGAGIMAIYPNHTFQPDQIVRRGDLATIVAGLVRLAGSGPGSDVARWEQARPRFPDLPSSNLYYRAAALAVASGAMTAEAGGQFDATRPVTGAELDAAVARVAQLSGR